MSIVAKALWYLENRYGQPGLSLDDVAAAVFRGFTGDPALPARHIHEKRDPPCHALTLDCQWFEYRP